MSSFIAQCIKYNLHAQSLIEQAAELFQKARRCTQVQEGRYTGHSCAMELLRIVTGTPMQTEFSPELFEKLVARITIISRKEAQFSLRCGLVLREEI